jgi:hypothetical protein
MCFNFVPRGRCGAVRGFLLWMYLFDIQ